MRIVVSNRFNSTNCSGMLVWALLGIIYISVVSFAIIDQKLIYTGVLLLPLLIYISIKNPFIFPFGAYVFFLPFDSISSITGDMKVVTLTRVLGMLTIIVFVLKGIFENKFRRPSSVTLWWILYVVCSLISLLWAISPESGLKHVSTAVGLLMLYLITTSYEVVEDDYEMLKMCILLGGLLTVAILIYGFIMGDFQRRAAFSFGGLSANPNGIAFSLLLPLSISIEKILRNTPPKKIIFAALLAIIVFCIILTGSRANMVAAGIIITLYFYYAKQKITLSAILILVGIILVQFIPNIFYERWSQAIDTGGSGRLDIWYVGWKAISRYWLVGAGLSNFPLAYNEFIDYSAGFQNFDRGSHNIYLKSIVELGITGFMLLILAIWKHYSLLRSRFIRGDVDQIMLKSAFWAILFSSFFNERMWDKGFWLIWMMIVIYRNMMDRHSLS